MHEASVCQNIVDTLQAELGVERLPAVRGIYMKIGVLSGIEPKLLAHAFKYVIEDSPLASCILYTELVEVSAKCCMCNNTFRVENYYFVCPGCNTPTSTIVEGNELMIYKITMEEPSYA